MICETLTIALRRMKHEVSAVTSGREALARVAEEPFDIVILDVRMPEMNGIEVLRALKAAGTRAGIVMLTGLGDVEEAVDAFRLGADDYLPKPVRLESLARVLQTLATSPRKFPEARPGGAS